MPMSYQIQEDFGNHHHRTETPNIIFELNLSVYERCVYQTIKKIAGDNGKCFKSSETLAKESGMDIRKYRSCLKSLSKKFDLIGKPLITVVQRKNPRGDFETNIITIVNIWPENYKYFYCDKGVVQQCMEGGGKDALTPLTKVHHKEDPIQEDPYNKQQQRAHEDDHENPNRDLLLSSKKIIPDQQPQKHNPKENPLPDKPTPKNYSAMFFTDSRGKKQQVYEEDVYRHFLKSNFPTEIIARAIEEAKTTEIVNNPLRFIEGICYNMMQPRNLRKISMDIEVSKKAEERRQRDERTKKIIEETKDERKSRFVYVDGRLTIERIT
jgi:Helix-turn-helix domain